MPPFDAADPGLLAAGLAAFGDGFQLRAVARTTSTQDLARAAARAGAAPGWCVVADEQSAGRGRQGRHWTARPGSALLTSVVIRPETRRLGWVSLAAGLGVADAVAAIAGVEVGLKWPNDVLGPDRRKLCGILAEVEARAPGAPAAVVLGVGINVTAAGLDPGRPAVSLETLTAPRAAPSRERLLAGLLTGLAGRLDALRAGYLEDLRRAFMERAAHAGERVTARIGGVEVTGTMTGVDDDGALVLATATGPRRLVAGDVHLGGGA